VIVIVILEPTIFSAMYFLDPVISELIQEFKSKRASCCVEKNSGGFCFELLDLSIME